MMSSQVIIESPEKAISGSQLPSFSYEHPEYLEQLIPSVLSRGFKLEHRVLDYCSGNGSVARLFWNIGAHNIVCLDKFVPNKPLVDIRLFKYIDVWELAFMILRREQLPDEIESLRNSFDWIIGAQTELPEYVHQHLIKFFLRPGGYAYPDQAAVVSSDLKRDGLFYQYVPE